MSQPPPSVGPAPSGGWPPPPTAYQPLPVGTPPPYGPVPAPPVATRQGDNDRRPPVSSGRAWLGFVLALVVAVGFALGWAYFVDRRTGVHPSGQVKGSAWTSGAGHRYELLSLTRVSELAGDYRAEKPPAGTSFVVATIRVSGQGGDDPDCSFSLLGQGQQFWASTSTTAKGLPTPCEATKTSGATTSAAVFVLPTDRWSQVRGVTPDPVMRWNQPPVLVPPD